MLSDLFLRSLFLSLCRSLFLSLSTGARFSFSFSLEM